ncbi:heavy metal-binding domain-containing protein [Vibrio sp. YIC-376]|uniref:heavy metal-binding domain-containing protein n=1 Tax=Vibrio sp. YIC-376 TaxID=3136162 RepID=UPI00402A60A7
MLKTTTSSVDGREIQDYLDVVVGEAILGANIFKDIFGAIRDVVGGRSGAYEEEMGKARRIAFAEMEEQAKRLGADGIVGIDIDYEVVGQQGGMMMVSVSGTAVRFKK